MAQNIIKGIEMAIKGLEMVRVELISQGAQEDLAVKVASILAGGAVQAPVEVKSEKTPKSNKVVELPVEEVATEETADVEVTGDRKTELEAMSYNEIKALVSSLGGKAVGNKAKLIDTILELEGAEVDGEDEEDESTQADEPADKKADTGRGKSNAKKSSTKPAEEVEEVEEEEEADEEESEDDDSEEFKEFLDDLDNDDLADVAEEMGIKVKKVTKKNREEILEKCLADLEKLQEALEELGYYDEEEDEEEADEEEVDSEDDEEEESDEEEEEEEDDIAEELGLNDMSVDELADILAEHDLSTKGKKQALIDRIVKAVEDGTIELDDEEEEEEEEEVKPAPKKGGKKSSKK